MDVKPERNSLPVRGARFWREDGEVMFEFVIDPGNVVGPRLAMKADSERHPEAWAMFTRGEAANPTRVEVLGGDDPEPPAEPMTVVAEKDMSGFAERLEPAQPVPRQKRKYARKAA